MLLRIFSMSVLISRSLINTVPFVGASNPVKIDLKIQNI